MKARVYMNMHIKWCEARFKVDGKKEHILATGVCRGMKMGCHQALVEFYFFEIETSMDCFVSASTKSSQQTSSGSSVPGNFIYNFYWYNVVLKKLGLEVRLKFQLHNLLAMCCVVSPSTWRHVGFLIRNVGWIIMPLTS